MLLGEAAADGVTLTAPARANPGPVIPGQGVVTGAKEKRPPWGDRYDLFDGLMRTY